LLPLSEATASTPVTETPPNTELAADRSSDGLARKLVVVAAFRIAMITLSLAASFALSTSAQGSAGPTWQYWLIATAYLVSISYAVALQYRSAVVVLAYAQIAIDAILVTWLVLMTGGIDSVFNFVYLFVVLGAGMTLFRPGVLIAGTASALLFGTVVLIQLDRSVAFLPPTDPSHAALSFFTYTMGFTLVGVLGAMLAETAATTGQRLAEKESDLEALEELYAAILRSLPAGLMTIDPSGTVRYANESATSILRLEAEKLSGRNLIEVVPSMAEAWRHLLEGGRPAHPRERYEGNYVTGGLTVRLGFSFAPLSSDPHRGDGLIVVFQDVTDIVRLKEAVERAERLASIGKLAAGLAHEVRNPLASMCASIEVLSGALDPPEAMRRLMDNVVKEADRLNVLITDFLTFARPRPPELGPIDVSVLLADVVEVFRHDAATKGVAIQLDAAPELVVLADPHQIRQVLWNLLRNAAEAIGRTDGRIDIRARAASDWVEVVLKDNGPGIPKELQKRIFDPFFTTKQQGTGLGLAIAHSIMDAHQAKMLVSSEPGDGTAFILRFQRKPDSSLPAPAPAQRDPELGVTQSDVELLGGPI
jgi:two-component system sensor histidine kinase PilS (NtrC family)